MTVHTAGWITGVALLGAAATAMTIAFADGGRPPAGPAATAVPTPDRKPIDVVRLIVDALGKNGPDNAGIRTTFRFASAGNRAATGPIDRFIQLVKSPAYAALLAHATADVREVEANGDEAVELVTLTTAGGERVFYLFQMSRETAAGPERGCWVTDGVIRVQPHEGNETQV